VPIPQNLEEGRNEGKEGKEERRRKARKEGRKFGVFFQFGLTQCVKLPL